MTQMNERSSDDIVERLRERAKFARAEGTGTSLGDALHFESAAAEIERLRAAGQQAEEPEGIQWTRINAEPFEYAVQQGRFGNEFVKLANGTCLRRAILPTPQEKPR